jgi:hypothetical protein
MLKTTTPGSQLAEIRRRIASIEPEIVAKQGAPMRRSDGTSIPVSIPGRLDVEISRRALATLQGDPEAARAKSELERQKEVLSAELGTLRQAEAQLVQAIAAEEDARRRAAAEALPAELAAGRTAVLRLDEEIEELTRRLAAKYFERRKAGQALAARSGSPQLKRHEDELPSLLKASAARHFVINAGAGAASASNNLLGIIIGGFTGPRAHWTLAEHDLPALDDLLPCFSTETEALAAKARLEARSTGVIVKQIGQTWLLFPTSSVFVDRAAAEQAVQNAARSGAKLVIQPHDFGFVVIPAALGESAEVLGTPAEAA